MRSRFVAAVVVVAVCLGAVAATAAARTGDTSARTRVLLVGDSLLYRAHADIRAGLGSGYVTSIVGGPGTGLLTDRSRWLSAIEGAVQTFDPDVVVIEACCNYDGDHPYLGADGTAIAPDTEAMYATWAGAARAAVARAAARDATVLWVVTPDADPAGWFGSLAGRVDRFDAIYARLGVPLVDWRSALEPSGSYRRAIDVGGVSTVVRADDGLHLSAAGSSIVARATVAAIRAARSVLSNPCAGRRCDLSLDR